LAVEAGKRPQLIAEELFRGERGYLSLELWSKEKELRGAVRPQFFTRSGEDIAVPGELEAAVKAVTGGVTCLGCSHPHYSRLAVEDPDGAVSRSSFNGKAVTNLVGDQEFSGSAATNESCTDQTVEELAVSGDRTRP
jgi:hypothetical protein